LDSAVVAALCKRAVCRERTLALMMPERDSGEEHIKDAQNLTKEQGIETRYIDLTPPLDALGIYRLVPLSRVPWTGKLRGYLLGKAYRYYEQKTGETPFSAGVAGLRGKEHRGFMSKRTAYYRSKHRMRMVLLYLHGELENRLVVGAANRTEVEIGYFVKHGCDDAVDVQPLLNLYKTQVRELAHYLGIPQKIIEKPPSPDVLPGIVDEEAIGIPYEQLDLILLGLEQGWQIPEIAEALGIPEMSVLSVKGLKDKSEHMRETYAPGPPGP
jgi:NAD+ synthase